MRGPRFAVLSLLSTALSPALLFVPAAVLAPLALTGCETEVQEGVVPPDSSEFDIEAPEGAHELTSRRAGRPTRPGLSQVFRGRDDRDEGSSTIKQITPPPRGAAASSGSLRNRGRRPGGDRSQNSLSTSPPARVPRPPHTP